MSINSYQAGNFTFENNAFISQVMNHKDENKLNNNLEQMTQQEIVLRDKS